MKKVTMRDVAEHAKVSKSTVSQYLNKRYDYMGAETKKRIEEAIRVLGYQPNYVARSLKQKKTSTIGVIVANILHSFSTQVIRAIEDYCHEQDFHVIVCNADDDPEKERKYIEMLRAKQVDGLIVFPTGENLDLYDRMIEEKFPLVFVDRLIDQLPVRCVLLDNEAASELAVDHLADQGYRRIAIMTTSLERKITPRIERISGYRKALEKHGLEPKEEYIKSLEIPSMKEEVKNMLSLPEPPDAILAANDMALMEILSAVKDENIRVPEELAVVGIDEVSFASLFTPSITTVEQPAFLMGKEAAAMLLELTEKPERVAEKHVLRYEPSLHPRESS
ncbi:LacI family DNA-binding transcriptional regulator [Alteribacter natronophilus]|uniref:LacI family DNA-binding transcriptional regulator n=1 Tax=Alteribacter natronophilus TaxID=2583810 RepID=UPI00110F028F|nr:substrate-binding domain-containing protein [Alteribacter natronophilus]TMW72285.1 LacI family DNA-binding transcriptional regulator [Alteribacter natronophilus]